MPTDKPSGRGSRALVVSEVQRWGAVANVGVEAATRYLGRTAIAKAAAATIMEIGRFTADRTRELVDYAKRRLVLDAKLHMLLDDGGVDIGRRLGSISPYELQLIDNKIRDAGIIDLAESLGVRDPREDIRMAELREEAASGDMDALYALATRYGPPPYRKRNTCRQCRKPFGITRYRHHCRHCGESFCQDHSSSRHAIPRMGQVTPTRVCDECKVVLEEEDLKDRIVWRLARVEAFLESRLLAYVVPPEGSRIDKALKVVGGAWQAARSAAPLGATAALATEAMELLRKGGGLSGMAGLLLRHEYVEAVEVLKKVSGVETAWPVSSHQLSAAMYYLLDKGRVHRGNQPDAEQEDHRMCTPISDPLLQDLLRLAPLSLHFIYCSTAVEMQRRARQQGWSLIFAHLDEQPGQPAFALLGDVREKSACLVVRGPSSVQDVIGDIHSLPMPFPQGVNGEKGGWTKLGDSERVASSSLGAAAHWLFTEVYPHLRRLLSLGYSLHLLGHSTGGAVAALLGVLLREEGVTEGIKCHAFGSPACVNGPLAQVCEAFSTVVVLHDDLVPRITPTAVRQLFRELLQERGTVERQQKDEVEAIIVRAKGLWMPRWRLVADDTPGTAVGSGHDHVSVRRRVGEEKGLELRPTGASAKSCDDEVDPGWDSCEDDFDDYFGVGCIREPAAKPRAQSQAEHFSYYLGDGTTATIDISAARRRLLGEMSYDCQSAPPGSTDEEAQDDDDEEEEAEEEGVHAREQRGGDMRGKPAEGTEMMLGPVRPSHGLAGVMWGQEEEEAEDSLFGGLPALFPTLTDEDVHGTASHSEATQPQHMPHEDIFSLSTQPAVPPPSTCEPPQPPPQQHRHDEDADERSLIDLHADGAVSNDHDRDPSPCANSLGNASVSSAGSSEATSAEAATPQGPQWMKHARPQPRERVSGGGGALSAMGGYAHRGHDDEEEEDDERGEGDKRERGGRGTDQEREAEGGVLVEDTELPEIYLPGKVVHIYSCRGVYRACAPDRDFSVLRRISLQGTMLRDHSPQAYFDGLCEAIDVRRAVQAPPRWQPFSEADECGCCKKPLLSMSTPASAGLPYTPRVSGGMDSSSSSSSLSAVSAASSLSTSQQLREGHEKHNCRCCGKVVCQACSKDRKALPAIGLALPARVCERCFFSGGMMVTEERGSSSEGELDS